MKYFIRIVTIIGLASISLFAYADSITDTYATGDTLTASTLDNIKSSVNDNDSRIDALESSVSGLQTIIQNLQAQSEGLGGGDFTGRTYCFFNVGRELVGENPNIGIYISHSTATLNFTSSTQVSFTDGGDVDAMLQTDTGAMSTGDTTPGGTTTIDSYSVTGNVLTFGTGIDFYISPDGNLLVGNQAGIEGTDPNSVHDSNFRIAVRGDSC